MENATPLSEMLSELRRELEQARLEGEGQGLHLRVESLEVDLQVTVSRSAEAKAGLEFWVLNGDAKGEIANASLQKLHLKLNPYRILADGTEAPLDVNDQRNLEGPKRTN